MEEDEASKFWWDQPIENVKKVDELKQFKSSLEKLKAKVITQLDEIEMRESVVRHYLIEESNTQTTTETMAAAEEDRIEEGNWDALKKVVRSLRMLYVAVVLAKARGETRMFEHTFRDLENTLDKFKSCKPLTPFAEESVIDLQFSNEELENLRAQLETGLELVEKCSKVHWWAIFK
ncbi:unnamed protein product [Malus baccata var. baccata]